MCFTRATNPYMKAEKQEQALQYCTNIKTKNEKIDI